MNISDSYLSSALSSYGLDQTQGQKVRQAESVQVGSTEAAKAGATSPTEDRIDLSGVSGQLLEASSSRDAKLEALAKAYAAGNYQVDAAALSQKLVDDAIAGSGSGESNG